jgi:hypothetical protein
VLAALRAERSTIEAGRRAWATGAHTDDGRHIARHSGARHGAGTRHAHAPDPGGPPRLRVLAAARTRRPARHTSDRALARRTAGV